MEAKEKITLAAVGAGCAAVIITLLVILFMQVGEMADARDTRDDAEQSLTGYYSDTRYPNTANQEIRKADQAAYEAVVNQAKAMLSHGLEVPAGETPSQFVTRIGETIRALNERQAAETAAAAKRGSAEPETTLDYAFGRYVVQGEMPSAENVPRLAAQFAAIEHVCNILLDKGATRITRVTRLPFDTEGQTPKAEETGRSARRTRRPAKTAEPAAGEAVAAELDPLLQADGITRESYTIQFSARYTALAAVLNELAKDPLFIVVTDVSLSRPISIRDRVTDMVKKREGQRAAISRRAANARTEAERQEADAKAKKPLFEGATPAERLVTDPANSIPLEITLKFDVYAAPPAPEAAAPAKDAASDSEGN